MSNALTRTTASLAAVTASGARDVAESAGRPVTAERPPDEGIDPMRERAGGVEPSPIAHPGAQRARRLAARAADAAVVVGEGGETAFGEEACELAVILLLHASGCVDHHAARVRR